MLWIDQPSYCGPDRRRQRAGMRLRERRRDGFAGPPPPLTTALRQLRLRVLDARGAAVDTFVNRAQAVSVLARMHGEHAASAALLNVAAIAARGRGGDVRDALYEGLDRVHAALKTPC